MPQTAEAECPAQEEKTYLYLMSYMESGKNGKPVVRRVDEPYTEMQRQFIALPFILDSEEKVRVFELALEKTYGKPMMIVGLSPLFRA